MTLYGQLCFNYKGGNEDIKNFCAKDTTQEWKTTNRMGENILSEKVLVPKHKNTLTTQIISRQVLVILQHA